MKKMKRNFSFDDKKLIERYSRQAIVPEFGIEGQKHLQASSAVIIGVGGIGTATSLYLVAAGIGYIHLVDSDTVELTNLHRQILFDESNIRTFKTDTALQKLSVVNSNSRITASTLRLTHLNCMDILRSYDVVIDATDNFETRYLISDACVLLNKPLITGSAVGLTGQVTVLCTSGAPCMRCLYPYPKHARSDRSCSDAGVLGPIPGLVGCLQALEAIKFLHRMHNDRFNSSSSSSKESDTGVFNLLINRQCLYDGLSGTFHTFELNGKRPDCPSCGLEPTIIDMDISQAIIHEMKANLCRVQGDASCPSVSMDAFVRCAGAARCLVLDVRSATQFALVSLHWYAGCQPPAQLADVIDGLIIMHIPLARLVEMNRDEVSSELKLLEDSQIYVLCRRGKDSITATHRLLEMGITAINLDGGLDAWRTNIDPNFPNY